MNIIVKKTTELSESEQYGILDLFNAVFGRRSIEYFRGLYFNTVLGYSYHVILYDGEKIGGCCSYLPSYYKVTDKKYLSALSVDTMISAEYRGQGHFKKMLVSGIDYMRDEGISFIINFPGDVSYPRYIKLKLRRDIGKLTRYVLPYRIGGRKSALRIFNGLSILLSNIYVSLIFLFASDKVHRFPIERDMETYKPRYSLPDGGYFIEQYESGGYVYKIMDNGKYRNAYLIDVFQKTARNFNIAIKHFIENHRKEFDLLHYIGQLPFGAHGLIKIPHIFRPRGCNFVGIILKENEIDANMFFDLNNWDVNLSNSDYP